ncbi:MAG: N-acetyltransferase [Candidatus Aenigmarchaeota archaeon]|nr:N-acetyltransferase [Candidatus Aenigmarchaeota archaeon]
MIATDAVVSKDAKIGEGTKIWHFAQIREGAVIGNNCNIGNGVYIDKNVKLGNNVVVQNKACIYRNAVVEDDVFIGPHVCIINDKNPRAGVIRQLTRSWVIGKGATIGAGSVIMPDINIGRYAIVGAGSVVTKDVPDHTIVYGNPAVARGFACECGQRAGECSCGKSLK